MSALYGFAYSEDALEALEALPVKIRNQVRRRIEALAANPIPPGCKKVQGASDGDDPVYRIRQGDYRVLYVVRDNPSEIIILDIGHRKDIYR